MTDRQKIHEEYIQNLIDCAAKLERQRIKVIINNYISKDLLNIYPKFKKMLREIEKG